MVKLSFFPRLSTAKPAPSNNAQSKKDVQTIMEKSPDKITEKSINTSTSEKSLDIIIEEKTGLQISPVSSSSGINKKSLQIIEIGKTISPKKNVKKSNAAEKTSLQIIEIGKNISPNLKSKEEPPIQNSSITVLQKSVDGRLVEVGKSLPKINTSISGKKPLKFRTNSC